MEYELYCAIYYSGVTSFGNTCSFVSKFLTVHIDSHDSLLVPTCAEMHSSMFVWMQDNWTLCSFCNFIEITQIYLALNRVLGSTSKFSYLFNCMCLIQYFQLNYIFICPRLVLFVAVLIITHDASPTIGISAPHGQLDV